MDASSDLQALLHTKSTVDLSSLPRLPLPESR